MVEEMKSRCEFCKRKIAPQGMLMHVSVKHRGMILSRFRCNPEVQRMMFLERGFFPKDQPMLPAPNPLTVYSRRPLGKMAAPIPELRRPKGYQPPQNYGQPWEMLAGQLRYGRSYF
jgi:hypothetical protein